MALTSSLELNNDLLCAIWYVVDTIQFITFHAGIPTSRPRYSKKQQRIQVVAGRITLSSHFSIHINS